MNQIFITIPHFNRYMIDSNEINIRDMKYKIDSWSNFSDYWENEQEVIKNPNWLIISCCRNRDPWNLILNSTFSMFISLDQMIFPIMV
jgi:hypothetical protein